MYVYVYIYIYEHTYIHTHTPHDFTSFFGAIDAAVAEFQVDFNISYIFLASQLGPI
jgi:hypothetical protein